MSLTQKWLRPPGLFGSNKTPALSSASTTGKSSRMSISRMSQGVNWRPSCSRAMRREESREHCEIASLKNNKPTEFCARWAIRCNVRLELLLFCGFALHVKVIAFSPCLTTLVATRTSRFTPLVATRTSGFTPLVATCAPPLTPFHTGRCWSGRRRSGGCWSGGCWSGWLCLSLSI